MKARDKRWWHEHWLAASVVAVSLLGAPLAYLSGKALARVENEVLENYGFQVSPSEVSPFNRLTVSGGGVVVRVDCGDEMDFNISDHPDKLYVIQRRPERLYIAGQQVTSSEPFVISIANPEKLLHLDIRNGARVEVSACAISEAQVTANLAAGSELAMSGKVSDLFLFASTGSSLLPGPQGLLEAEKVIVDMVFGSSADLCGVTYGVRGTAALGSVIKVPEFVRVLDLHSGSVSYSCELPKEEVTT